eukprot:g7508.t1
MRAGFLPCSSRVFLLPVLGLMGALVLWVDQASEASGWEDCTISPQDEWRRATEPIPALRMRHEFSRKYTCEDERASFEAASYFFDSPCTGEGFFYPGRILSCLEGRRVVFMGDSLSIQQADSLVGMLGWHPYWIEGTNPYNGGKGDSEGKPYRLEVRDCWREAIDKAPGLDLCWDLYERDFDPAPELFLEAEHGSYPEEPSVEALAEGGEVSVHARDYSFAVGGNWFTRALKDFNETRPSDVFIVNFGAHYHETPEGDQEFKDAVFPMLDEMAEVGKTATVVWREISPVHFPSPNATWEGYDALDAKQKRGLCCTGTPPRVLTRNKWVEDYLEDNGLTDTVKLLRIYDMSLPRAAAHHTCNMAPPSTMDQRLRLEAATEPSCHTHGKMDCRHWSSTGVVEEWNALLLHHLCPAG